jgi:manganese oxidase
MNVRSDGGPTSWHGYIVPKDPKESYREFMLEFQDLQLAYNRGSRAEVSSSLFDPGNDPGNSVTAPAAFDLAQAHSITVPGTDFKTKTFPAFVAALNSGKLPVGTGSPPELLLGFPELFLQFGVPLSPKAVVKKIKDDWWTITEAPGEKNAGLKYVVHALHQSENVNGFLVDFVTHLLVYTPDISPGWAQPNFALNAPGDSANASNGPPFPGLVSTGSAGTYSVNYRNEPVPLRLGGTAPTPDQSDLALVFSSILRDDADLNVQPDPLDLVNAQPDDPFTPLLEAYANDKVQVRTLVGAHVQSHAFEIHGVNWLFEPTYQNSGYRNAQLMGLSEHFEMLFDLPPVTFEHSALQDLPAFADYFYSPSSDIVGLNNGLWGIMRVYGSPPPALEKRLNPLPNNEHPASSGNIDLFEQGYTEAKQNAEAKKTGGAPTREFDVTAVTAEAALENGKLILNGRDPEHPLYAKDALLFVRTSDLAGGKLKPGVPVEPLILRAAAGEWIKVTVRNGFKLNNEVFQNRYSNNLPYGTPFTATPEASPSPTPPNNTPLPLVPLKTSSNVGLHPQLVAYDPVNANGLIVGFNPSDKLVAPGTSQDFYWYAGKVTADKTGKKIVTTTPIEFGGTNLVAADQLIQPQFGMVGALVIEPEGSSWAEDISARAAATVTKRDGTQFREFVVVDQNMFANSGLSGNLNNLNPQNGGSLVGAINFRSEPFIFRGSANDAPNLPQPPPKGFSLVFSNTLFADKPADPVTPVFVAPAGMATRFRLVVPSTSTNNTAIIGPPVFIVHGHNWQEEPYTDDSTKIGNNRLSEHLGAIQAGPNQKFDLVFDSAGGSDKVPGDYLYDTYQTGGTLGTWGVFRVTKEEVVIDKVQLAGDSLTANGSVRFVTANGNDPLPKQLKIFVADSSNARIDLGQAEVDAEGKWSIQTAIPDLNKPFTIQAMAFKDGTAGATAVTEIEP